MYYLQSSLNATQLWRNWKGTLFVIADSSAHATFAFNSLKLTFVSIPCILIVLHMLFT